MVERFECVLRFLPQFIRSLTVCSGKFGLKISMRHWIQVLILENGAYGLRQVKMCEYMGIDYHHESFGEKTPVDPHRVRGLLKKDRSFTHISIVHCETSVGLLNPITDVGRVVREVVPSQYINSIKWYFHVVSFPDARISWLFLLAGSLYFVDAMSTFGAVPINMINCNIDFLVSSSNKCIQGTPGFSYVIANKEKLLACKGNFFVLTFGFFLQSLYLLSLFVLDWSFGVVFLNRSSTDLPQVKREVWASILLISTKVWKTAVNFGSHRRRMPCWRSVKLWKNCRRRADQLAEVKGTWNFFSLGYFPPFFRSTSFVLRLSWEEDWLATTADHLCCRYRNNCRVLTTGMNSLGFRQFLDPQDAGYIITTYLYPDDPNFEFSQFYNRLYEKGWSFSCSVQVLVGLLMWKNRVLPVVSIYHLLGDIRLTQDVGDVICMRGCYLRVLRQNN